MHTLSVRVAVALAHDRGEEYDPGLPVPIDLMEALSLVEHAGPVIGEPGSYEKARMTARKRRARAAIQAWPSAEDLIPLARQSEGSRFM
jgi:hypothetical protein